MSDFLVAAGKAVISLRGVLGPGEMIEKKDLKTPENFDILVEKGTIVSDSSYVESDENVFKKFEVKKDVEKTEKTSKSKKTAKTNTPVLGAQKKG